MKKHTYSEIFGPTLQGEGMYTGKNSVWVRWFMCNLKCEGFSQTDPTDPETYDLPYKTFDLIGVKSIEELPVFEKGCDTGYSWSQRYKHLVHSETAETIADKLVSNMTNEYNPKGLFKHATSGQDTHLCFTGGEPMMKHSQQAMCELMEVLQVRDNSPDYVTIESNGTQKLSDAFVETFKRSAVAPNELFWSISPKLFNVSGETNKKAIKPNIVKSYADMNDFGQLKFVLSDSKDAWEELDKVVLQFREAGVNWPIYIMPAGATKEQQESDVIVNIVNEALSRGYNISGRLHCNIFGNSIGT